MVRPEHALGAANEHVAASYFLRRGFEVFWPAIQQGSADFVIRKGRDFGAVQVKTATWNKSSPPYAYLQSRIRPGTTAGAGRKPTDVADLYAIVHAPDIWVIPSAEIDSSNLSLGSTREPRKPTRWDHYKDSLFPDVPA